MSRRYGEVKIKNQMEEAIMQKAGWPKEAEMTDCVATEQEIDR